MFGGPLSSLYYMGFIPCCQKEEDRNAREALSQINTVGARIIWHREKRRLVENVKAAAFSFLSSKKKTTNDDDDKNPLVKAQFRLFDNDEGIPEIQVSKRNVAVTEVNFDDAAGGDATDGDFGLGFGGGDDAALDAPSSSSSWSSKRKNAVDKHQQINISLKRIHTVVPVEQDLVVLTILEADGQKAKEWVRFGLDAQDQAARNMLVHNLQVLMEWDRQRRSNCGELEYDETSAASTLKARAQKAAHFARRELEMKQTRRSREERKAKYVQESGGLKYTALAMAKNATVT